MRGKKKKKAGDIPLFFTERYAKIEPKWWLERGHHRKEGKYYQGEGVF